MSANQPRKPKGAPNGGQFDRSAGGGIAAPLGGDLGPLGRAYWDFSLSKPKPGDSGFDFETVLNWWPESVGDSSDLPEFSGWAWRHVMFGDEDDPVGGGHLRSVVQHRITPDNKPKTAYPATFGADHIGDAAAQTLRISAKLLGVKANQVAPDSEHEAIIVVDGYRIFNKVILDYAPDGSAILTTFPIRGDGVVARIGKRIVDRPLLPDER